MSVATLLERAQVVQAKGAPQELSLQASDSGYQIVTQSGEVIGALAGSVPAGFELTVYAGKGGNSLVLKEQQPQAGQPPLLYFVLPGGQVEQDGFKAQLHAIETEPVPVGPPAPPVEQVQTVTEQAMILGAGIGTRILPLTEEYVGIAKPALPLDGDNTVIGRIVLQLAKHGIKRLYVNTFYLRASVQKALNDACSQTGMTLYEIPEKRATGTCGGLCQILAKPADFPDFQADQPLLIVQGDAVTDANFTQLLDAHAKNDPLLTLGGQVVRDEDVSKFGILCTERSAEGAPDPSGTIKRFLEKPKLEAAGKERFGSTGFYVLSPKVYDVLMELFTAKVDAEKNNSDFDGLPKEVDFANDLFPVLMERIAAGTLPSLFAQKVDGFWCDIGNPMQYYQTMELIYDGKVPFELPSDTSAYAAEGSFFWGGLNRQTLPVAASGAVIVGRAFA